MSANRYAEAILPTPFTLLGLGLKPFSIGHYLLMSRFNCAFANDSDAVASVPDLLLGLCICSRSYEDFLAFIEDEKESARWLKKWGKHIQKQCKTEEMIEKFYLFKQYMAQGTVIPKYWNEDGEAKQSGAHWSQNVLNVLVAECGYTQTEALNAPLARAFADFFKFAERNGLVTLMSDDEIALFEGQPPTQGVVNG